MENMYYIGLDVHKKTISYCVKDGSGRIYAEAEIPAASWTDLKTFASAPPERVRRAFALLTRTYHGCLRRMLPPFTTAPLRKAGFAETAPSIERLWKLF